MAAPKMPPRDEKELDRIRKLFEKGLTEAAKDPERLEYLRREKEQMIKPWEDYLSDWKPAKKEASALESFEEELQVHRVASRFVEAMDFDELAAFEQAVQQRQASQGVNVPGVHIFQDAKVLDKAQVLSRARVMHRTIIMNEAKISGRAQISDEAIVAGSAQVTGKAVVRGKAEIVDKAQVFGSAEISDTAYVGGKAQVFGKAQVSGNAQVTGKARIGGDAVILGGTWDGSEGEILSGRWLAPGVPA